MLLCMLIFLIIEYVWYHKTKNKFLEIKEFC